MCYRDEPERRRADSAEALENCKGWPGGVPRVLSVYFQKFKVTEPSPSGLQDSRASDFSVPVRHWQKADYQDTPGEGATTDIYFER